MAGRVERRLRPAATPGYWRRHTRKAYASNSFQFATGRILEIRPAATLLFLDQRTLAFAERPRGLLRRDRRDQLVVIPRIFGFLGLLHLKQIGRKHLATVGAHGALSA